MFRLIALLALLASLLPGLAMAEADNNYVIGPGDVVKVSVYEHPDLTAELAVSEAGNLRLPLIGEIHAAGASGAALESAIASKLEKGGFVKNPSVNVLVTQYRSQQITVLGQVNRPGKYPIQMQSNVMDLVAMAGGITPTGADSVVLIRKDNSRVEIDLNAAAKSGDPKAAMAVANGDTLFVPRAPQFYIYGEVQRPGAYRLEKNMSVMQALSAGGGLTPKGTQRGITVMRPAAGGNVEKIHVELGDMLKPDDVVYVQESLF